MSATETCCECRQVFPTNEMIKHGQVYVCASCKPIFLQKLQEGVAITGNFRYGGFWIRFGAKVIDAVVLNVISYFAGMIVGSAAAASGSAEAGLAAVVFSALLGIAIGAAYTTFFLGRFGATLGKMACGLRVIMPDGARVSYLRALGRHFAEILSGMILAIGYIMVAFDDEKRALHDRICDTRVVYK